MRKEELKYLDELIDSVEGDSHPGAGGDVQNPLSDCVRCQLVDVLRNFKNKIKIANYASLEFCYKCQKHFPESDLDLHNGEWLCHNCEENEQKRSTSD